MRYSYSILHSRFLPFLVVGILIIAMLLAGTFGRSIAYATGKPSFGLQPVLYDPSQPATKSYFIFNTHPDTTLYNHVRVTNSGTATGTVNLYTVDATTGQTGGVVYLSHNNARHDVGAWITLGLQSLTLAPGQSLIVPFQVTIPSIVRPGQHVGGIVAENQEIEGEGTPGTNALHINVRNLAITAVQINLPGTPIEQLAAKGIQPGGGNNYQSLSVALDNTGTMMLKPYGSLRVTDVQGHLLQNLPVKLDTFLPQTVIKYPVYIKGLALSAGIYHATLTLLYGHNHVLYYTQAFVITQQQSRQVFLPSTSSQSPQVEKNFLSTMPLWQIVLGVLLLASGLFFWGQQLYRFSAISRRKASNKKVK